MNLNLRLSHLSTFIAVAAALGLPPGIQTPFRRGRARKVYPFSSVRQESRQRRQFALREAKRAARVRRYFEALCSGFNSHADADADADAEARKATIRTVAADGTVTYQWEDSEGYNTLCTCIPDPGQVFYTPHASVPIAGPGPDVA